MFDETDQWLVNEEEKNFEKKNSVFLFLSSVISSKAINSCLLRFISKW